MLSNENDEGVCMHLDELKRDIVALGSDDEPVSSGRDPRIERMLDLFRDLPGEETPHTQGAEVEKTDK